MHRLLALTTLLLTSLSLQAADEVVLAQDKKAPRDKFQKTTVEPAKLAGTYVGLGYASQNMLVKRTLQLAVKGEWVSGTMLDMRPGQFVRDGVKSTFTSSDLTTDDNNQGTYLNFGPAKAEYVTFTDEENKPHEGILVESCFLEKQVKAEAAKKKK